ncbi:MAG: pyrroline-5-carboxylate reductase [Chitinophagaceae bacterium]
MSKKIAIIGGGNLGSSIALGLLASGFTKPEHVLITKRNIQTLKSFEEKGVLVSDNNADAIQFAELIILAVKPFQVEAVLENLHGQLDRKRHLLVSVVTGVTIGQILSKLKEPVPVVRAMPNTAIAIQESMTCLAARDVNKAEINFVEDLFKQLGRIVWIDEKLMDAATVLGACGTAYAMRYIRANIQGGIEIGFDAATASLIAAQTVKGAAELLLKNKSHPEQEIDKVTTPRGCTIAGLNQMEHEGFSSSLIKGIVASYDKIGEGN